MDTLKPSRMRSGSSGVWVVIRSSRVSEGVELKTECRRSASCSIPFDSESFELAREQGTETSSNPLGEVSDERATRNSAASLEEVGKWQRASTVSTSSVSCSTNLRGVSICREVPVRTHSKLPVSPAPAGTI